MSLSSLFTKKDFALQIAAIRALLQTGSLYSSAQVGFPPKNTPEKITELLPPGITYPCPTCVSEETTSWRLGGVTETISSPTGGELVAPYTCVSCHTSVMRFWLLWVADELFQPPYAGVRAATIRKMGQAPEARARMSKTMQKALGATAPLYTKGVACLREGLGIGASAYFRRIIEEKVEELIAVSERIARESEDQKALDQITKARQQNHASDRLRVAAEHVPAMLRKGGSNPLAVLYGAYSGGIHTEPEDQALQTAAQLQKAFKLLFESVQNTLEELGDFHATIDAAQNKGG